VSLPVAAQPRQQLLADGHLAALAPLAVDDSHHPALAVDMAGLEVGAFAEPQPEVVHHGEQRPEVAGADRAEQGGHPVPADDVGQLFLAVELDVLPALPLAAEVVAVEGAQRAQRLVDGRIFQFKVRLQIDQELEDLPLAEAPDRLAAAVLRQTPHPREVGLARARLEVSKLDKGGELLVPRLRGDGGVPIVFLVVFHRTSQHEQDAASPQASSSEAPRSGSVQPQR
jgi:hypothetical protein